MVSHDLRNPLNVASGRLEMQRKQNDSEHLAKVDDALVRMENLISNLLELARQGKPIDEVEDITLSSLVQACWDVIETKEAELQVQTDLKFMGDRERVQQLFENLIRNAIDHGGDDVEITVGSLPDGSGFYVADNGPGIPSDQREDVFGSGVTTDANGTGFGLAIVKEIVDAHDWRITIVESSSGGARFEISHVNPLREEMNASKMGAGTTDSDNTPHERSSA
jgi:signal transduction histidine kinase